MTKIAIVEDNPTVRQTLCEWINSASDCRCVCACATGKAALAEIPGATVRDVGAERCGIVTFTLAGYEPGAIKQALGAQGINVHVSVAGDSRLEVESREQSGVVRASVHYYNSEEEIERLGTALRTLSGATRGSGA